MASLPPKPVSSPPPLPGKDDDDRRRPHDRPYVHSRSRPMADTYIASYDRGRDDDRYGERHRDRDWDRRNWDRGPRGREDDRDRFRYDRGRGDTYIAHDDRRARRPPSPRRPDRYRSRSPRSRRPYSPPRHVPRTRYSRSPPPSRRHRYNESRSPRRGRSRSRSRTPERRKREYSRESLNRARPLNVPTSPSKRRTSRSPSRTQPIHKSPDDGPLVVQNARATEQRAEGSSSQNGSSQQAPDRVHRSKDASFGDKLEQKPRLSPPVAVQRSPRHVESNKNETRSPKRELQTQQDPNVKRSPSPPRQPRHMGNQPTRDGQYARRTSRSPPRGPRNAAKIFSAPGATPPSHTTGSHGGRRPPPPGRPAHGPHDAPNLTEPHIKRSNRLERAPITASLDAEIARLESHRASLQAEYVELSKNTKRALHELDMATVDLRAAEARRKVADSHLKRARVGMFGIDAVPVESPLAI